MSCKRRASRSCASPSSCRYWRSRSAKRWRKRTWPTAEIRWCNLRREQARVGLDQAPHQAKIMVKRERAAHTFGSRPYGARSPPPASNPAIHAIRGARVAILWIACSAEIATSTDRDACRRQGAIRPPREGRLLRICGMLRLRRAADNPRSPAQCAPWPTPRRSQGILGEASGRRGNAFDRLLQCPLSSPGAEVIGSG